MNFMSLMPGIKANLQRYEQIGIKVHFTEVDVICRKGRNGKCVQYTAAEQTKHAEIFNALLKVCLEAPNCEEYATWGFTDKYSWLKGMGALPMDEQFRKKKAYYEMLKTLKTFPRNHPAVVARNKNIANRPKYLQLDDITPPESNVQLNDLAATDDDENVQI